MVLDSADLPAVFIACTLTRAPAAFLMDFVRMSADEDLVGVTTRPLMTTR